MKYKPEEWNEAAISPQSDRTVQYMGDDTRGSLRESVESDRGGVEVFGWAVSQTAGGYWRYVDLPEQEKLAGEAPSASLGHLREELEDVAATLKEIQARMGGLEDEIDGVLVSIGRVLAEDKKPIREILEDHKLTSELPPPKGWNKVTETEPPSDMRFYELHGLPGQKWMRSNDPELGFYGEDMNYVKPRYWRVSKEQPGGWLEASPKNLANLKDWFTQGYYEDPEVVEVKLADGSLRKGFRTPDGWHICGTDCGIAPKANSETGKCIACVSTAGTYFRKLSNETE